MNLVEQNICPNCGGKMNNKDSRYDCLYCGKSYREENIAEKLEDVKKHLKGIVTDALVEQRLSDIANARRNLYQAIHEDYIDSNKVKEYSRKLKEYLPDDMQANFYETAVSSNAKAINKYIDNIDTEEYDYLAGDIIEFMIKSLEKSNILPLKNLADKVYRLNDHDKFLEYTTRIESEAEKIDKGIYKTDLPRKVFVAYSSADIEKVNEITEYLEENGISCFVAARNLRHGKGAVENYKKNLETAMRNCKCLVFVSSENSRSLECDAIDVELPYIKENLPRMGRIEYIAEEYGNTPAAVKNYLKDFFKGLEYCRTKEDLANRILNNSVKKQIEQTEKYCKACGAANLPKAKFCLECGNTEFVDTYEEYVKIKTEEQVRKEYEQEIERLKKQLSEREERKETSEVKTVSEHPTVGTNDFEIEDGVLIKYHGNDEHVVIPDGVKSIENSAFLRCTSLLSIVIPNSVISIGTSAFKECCNISSVKLNKGLRSIKAWAFKNCIALSEIVLPSSVTNIEGGLFEHCDNLTNITIDKENESYHSFGNCIIETATKILIEGCKNSTIPTDGSVEKIGRAAFSDCDKLTAITIPNAITCIEDYAFSGCRSLTRIDIPSSVTSIGSYAFSECDNLVIYCSNKGITFGKNWHGNAKVIDSVVQTPQTTAGTNKDFEIKDGVLIKYHGNDEHVVIPDGIKSIGKDCFIGCESLTEIKIPESLTKIDECAFYHCKNLTGIELPDGLTVIGLGMFCGCESLTAIKIPQSVTSIGDCAFWGCKLLKNIEIPQRVTSIGGGAFRNCTGLTSLEIPRGVKNIGFESFRGCTGLTEIKYGGTKAQWKAFNKNIGCSRCTIVCSDGTIS